MVNLEEFLRQAADCGPCVGVHALTPSPLIPPNGVELRTVDGADTTTIDRLFDAFAAVWDFPPRFAQVATGLPISGSWRGLYKLAVLAV